MSVELDPRWPYTKHHRILHLKQLDWPTEADCRAARARVKAMDERKVTWRPRRPGKPNASTPG